MIERIRAARPDMALSGDFIVGFPGETEADFRATLALVEAVGYAQAYSFAYSPRPGTPAAERPEVDPARALGAAAAAAGAARRGSRPAFQAGAGRADAAGPDREAGTRAGQMAGKSPYLNAVHLEAAARSRRRASSRSRVRRRRTANSLAGALAA